MNSPQPGEWGSVGMEVRMMVGGMSPVHRHAIESSLSRLHEEFRGRFAPETVDRVLLDSVDRLLLTADNVAAIPLLAERFARQRLEATRSQLPGPPTVLFVCGHNSARSQIAAGFSRALAGAQVVVYTGGTDPAPALDATVVEAMAELGIDIADEFPKPLTVEVLEAAEVIVTMGCGDACPFFPGKRYLDWELEDPVGLDLESVRPIRDEIRTRVMALLESLGIAVNDG